MSAIVVYWVPLSLLPTRKAGSRRSGPSTIRYLSESDPSLFFGTIAGDAQTGLFQHPLHDSPWAHHLAFDGVAFHRGVGRVSRASLLGDSRDDAAHGSRRAHHALRHPGDDDDLPLPCHGAREDETPLGGGGAQVFRLWLGLVGTLPLWPQHGLRAYRDDSIRVDSHGSSGPGPRPGSPGMSPVRRRSC